MWNNNSSNNNNDNSNNKEEAQLVKGEDEDDSWEIRAFEEDITAGNQLGCTWPPRSYTCNFCRREFRSAQALGGHMNVHRRDRARLHHHHPILPPPPSSSSSCNVISNGFPKSSTINLVPAAAQELILPNGLCLFYSLPNPNGEFAQNYLSASTPHLISVSPPNYPPPVPVPVDIMPDRGNSDISNKTETSAASNISSSDADEVDLELRLGRGLISKDKSP